MSLGESILDHYELFLGKYIGVDKYTSGEYVIQLLGFDRTFKDCLTFASLGLSNYSNLMIIVLLYLRMLYFMFFNNKWILAEVQ